MVAASAILTPPPDQAEIDAYYSGLLGFWHPIAKLCDIAAAPLKIRLLGRDLVLARLDKELVAFDDLCRHFQAKLSDGTIEQAAGYKVLRCKYHGWAYDKTGQCVEIPQLSPERTIPSAARVRHYEVAEKYGLAWVCLDPVSKRPIPDFPEALPDDMHTTRVEYSEPWRCSVIRMILSALDDYHFAWLHEGVLGTRDNPQHPNRQIERFGLDLVSRFSTEQPQNVTNAAGEATESSQSNVRYTMIVNLPNIMRIIKESGLNDKYVIRFFPTPHDYNSTGIFWSVCRNYETDLAGEEKILEFEAFIQSQDRPIVSNQRPWLQSAMPIKGPDDALMAYLAGCRELNVPVDI